MVSLLHSQEGHTHWDILIYTVLFIPPWPLLFLPSSFSPPTYASSPLSTSISALPIDPSQGYLAHLLPRSLLAKVVIFFGRGTGSVRCYAHFTKHTLNHFALLDVTLQ